MREGAGPAVCAGQDTSFDDTLRPASFADFVGQRKTVANLQIAIKAARKRKEALDHVLLSGMPGLGKTTLARIIALEMKSNFQHTSGPILKRPGDLAGMLTKLEEGDVLFIDEIHRMQADVEEYLYSAMEDFFIPIAVETGPNGRTINIPLKKFTLVGATTREGLLSEPFRARFGILEKLEPYPVEDLITIILRSGKILSAEIDADAAKLLSGRARGTPRIANRYLRRVRDLAQVKGRGRIEAPVAVEGLRMLGVDDAGLDDMDRKILRTLINHAGGPLGLKTISVAVGEQEDTIEEVYEPYLIQQDFLQRTTRGRKATEKAWRHLGAPPMDPIPSPQRQLFT
ncbi:MAG: Holliday junction branch migration DNA helicase RuvB [Planctomycetes bacterium]|nr:Holliday junction branch migration DNA helicase RuvB [Planctomycetota bacterium]